MTTILWSAIAFAVPINYALPSVARVLWFVTIMGLIASQVLTLRMARPLYPQVWIFAGFAAVVATLTATKKSTIEDNLFVGAQLTILLGFAVFVLTANALTDPKFVRRVGVSFLIGQCSSGVAAMLQTFGRSLSLPGSNNGHGRAFGLAEHPNTLGLTAAIAALLALQILFTTRRFRFLLLTALILNLLTLAASGSLSSMVAFATGFAVWAICARYHLLQMTIGTIVFGATVWIGASFSRVGDYLPSLVDRYKQVTGQTAAESSWELRQRTLDFAWRRISDDPIAGGGFGDEAGGTFNGVTLVHNAVLRGWFQGGVLLALAMVLVFGAVLIVSCRAMNRREYCGEVSVLVAVMVYASISPLLEQRHYWLIVLVAWASISASMVEKTARDRAAVSREPS